MSKTPEILPGACHDRDLPAAARAATGNALMGILRSAYRRTFGPTLPTGLAYCRRCGEPRGRTRFSDAVTNADEVVEIQCLCNGLRCQWCRKMPIPRPHSVRFDPFAATIRYVATFGSEAPCSHCLARVAARNPHTPRPGVYHVGATPFRGEAPATDDYYSGQRYRLFEAGLPQVSAEHGLTLLGVKKVRGLWRGEQEPAAMISVAGTAGSVLEMMAELANRWSQEGVICFSPGADGSAKMYRGSVSFSVDHVCSAVGEENLSGITVDLEGTVMIVDLRGEQSVPAVTALARLGVAAEELDGYGFLHLR